MAYALDTSKRKFHRILDSISNNSSTSPPSKRAHDGSIVSVSAEPPSKKIRYARPHSADVSKLSLPLSRNVSTSTLSLKSSGSTQTQSARKMDKPPTFVPWDRSQFLERLRTFTSVINWSPKPDIINEVQWAKWGWKCDGRETVKCVSCSKRIVINLCMDNPLFKNFSVQEEGLVSNNEEIEARPDQAFEALHEKYASMMKEGHYHDCLWSQKGCDGKPYLLFKELNLTEMQRVFRGSLSVIRNRL